MKNLSFLLLGFLILVFSYCGEKSKSSISVDFTELSTDLIPIDQIQLGITDSLRRSVGEVIELDLSSPSIISIGDKNKVYAYVKAGEAIRLTNASKDSFTLDFAGELSPENRYLQKYTELNRKADSDFDIFPLSKYEPALFLDSLTIKYAGLTSLVDEIQKDNTVDPRFVSVIKERLSAKKAADLIFYPDYYKYQNENDPELLEGYYDFVEGIDLNSESLLCFSEGRRIGDQIIGRDINYEEFESTTDYFNAKLDKVASVFTNKTNRDYFTFLQMESLIDFGGGIDGLDDKIASFRKATKNKYLLDQMKAVVDPWIDLKSGKTAPDFAGYTRDGEKIDISSLRGKNVYVDVWATWCGPCIREIPALKEVEKSHHDDNIAFVSISIDEQKDADKWKKFVEDKSLSGTQIMADKDWSSDVVKEYNIKGIPRFILIDDKGNIVKADAPRPSDPKLLDLFKQLDI